MRSRLAASQVAPPSATQGGSLKGTQKPGPLKTMTGIFNLTQVS